MRTFHLFTILCTGLLSVACSSDSGTATANSNAITTATATAIAKVEAMTAAKPAASLIGGLSFGDNWTTTAVIGHPMDGGGTNSYSGIKVTVKQYMAYQFDPTAVNSNSASINLFGRIRSAVGVFCALGKLLPAANVDTNGYPTNGNHSIAFTSANEATLKTDCYIDSSSLSGKSITMAVSDATDTTYYDKKISFTMPGDTDAFIAYIRSNSSNVNIATFERSSNGRYRTLVQADLTNKIARMEYLSLPTTASPDAGGLYGYRMYLNETADEGFILVREGGSSSDYNGMRYSLAGKPKTSSANLSLSMSNSNIGDSTAATSHEACYSTSGTVVTDGSICSSPTVSLIPTAQTILTGLWTNRGNAGLYTNEGPTVGISAFNATTMYTTAFSW